jgi:BirA family biotin operon repressor/biotin-[acetyl-CoA-carboxylase] ligase
LALIDLELVRMLADGRFHSGEGLGRLLGISRAAVWKRLQSLAEHGIDIERVRGRGYRLPGGLSLLDRDLVVQQLGQYAGAVDIDVRIETGSTNVDALYAAREGLARPCAVLAEYQAAGRGRRGRVWASPLASSLYLSMAFDFALGAAELEGLSLAVGVAVAETAERLKVPGVALKWPNDILVGDRKLGGILIELAGELDARCIAIVGVGINGALPPGVDIDQPYTDIFRETGQRPDRNAWAAALVVALLDMANAFRQHGFAAFAERWQRFDAFAGREVAVFQGKTCVEGVARGVSPRGALRVETPEGVREFHGGEITLRKKQIAEDSA